MAKSEQSTYDYYRERVKIDRTDLLGALEEQPELFSIVADNYSRKNNHLDALKKELEDITAELDKSIRTEALQKEVKITETAIANQIKLDPKVQKLQQAILEAGAEVRLWFNLKQSYEQRSYALKDIARLTVAQMGFDNEILGTEQARNTLLAMRSDVVSKQAGEMRREKIARRKKSKV